MGDTFVGVRDVDEEIFRKFRALAIGNNIKIGKALNRAMEKMIEEHNKKSIKIKPGILEIKPLDFGANSENLSERVDEILYGE